MKNRLFPATIILFAGVTAALAQRGYTSLVSVTDNSVAEWDSLPSAYVFESVCPSNANKEGLKDMKVYADDYYINILTTYDPYVISDLSFVPIEIFIDTDNSDSTGGYSDTFTDANTDILLEGGVFNEGVPESYNPAVYRWWGEVGGSGWEWSDESVAHSADDYWGALVGEGQLQLGNSQVVNNKIEIQLFRTLIPATWSDSVFGIGLAILQNWDFAGLLPQAPVTDTGAPGKAPKLKVTMHKRGDTATPPVTVIGGDTITTDSVGVIDISGDGSVVLDMQEQTITFSSADMHDDIAISVDTFTLIADGNSTLTVPSSDAAITFDGEQLTLSTTDSTLFWVTAGQPVVGNGNNTLVINGNIILQSSTPSPAAARKAPAADVVLNPALSRFRDVQTVEPFHLKEVYYGSRQGDALRALYHTAEAAYGEIDIDTQSFVPATTLVFADDNFYTDYIDGKIDIVDNLAAIHADCVDHATKILRHGHLFLLLPDGTVFSSTGARLR